EVFHGKDLANLVNGLAFARPPRSGDGVEPDTVSEVIADLQQPITPWHSDCGKMRPLLPRHQYFLKLPAKDYPVIIRVKFTI
ncbi:MAG: hypothetical protein V3R70_04815, partial [Syntrophobacteria bacterium]